MSCTENESGPFVVFFLPAVVGCLTILLARRWANSQVANTSSTAVSRRRKIIKDPLVKRPLPPIACKMVAPSSKKSSGVAKKQGTYSVPEEEMNGGGKRMGRSTRLSPSSSAGGRTTDIKLVEGPVVPKHIPFPPIPQDGELLFETMTFTFTMVATGLQFLNLYRTMWWLPHSYTNQTMNFYLIEPHLVVFIVTIALRRLLFSVSLAVLRHIVAPKAMPHATIAARMFILGLMLGSIGWCSYFIVLKYPIIKIFYLCYPIIIYFILFRLNITPFLELNSDSPLHCCTHDPQLVRSEVDVLREDFNSRIKKMLFNSVVDAYYSSFIPCCFAQSYLYYDVYAAAQQTALVWGALCGRYAAQLLSGCYCDVPHRAALHLGRWAPAPLHAPADAGGEGPCPAAAWSAARLWALGERATWQGRAHVASAPSVAAKPLDPHHRRFYAVFINPSMLLCLLLSLQLSLIVVQLCLLFSNVAWHNFIAMMMLLFISYYSLFKMLRDYLVAWKVYKAENMIQDKNGQTVMSN